MTTGKTIALTIQTIVSKVIFLHFNMLSRFVIAFLPRSNYLLISWLQTPSSVILEPKKIKSVTVSIFILGSPNWHTDSVQSWTNSQRLFCIHWLADAKFYMDSQNNFEKQYKVGELIRPNFKPEYKATMIKTA